MIIFLGIRLLNRNSAPLQKNLANGSIGSLPVGTITELHARIYEGGELPIYDYNNAGYHAETDIVTLIKMSMSNRLQSNSGVIHMYDHEHGIEAYLRFNQRSSGGLRINIAELDPAHYLVDRIHDSAEQEQFIRYARAYVDYQQRQLKAQNLNHEIELTWCCNVRMN